MRAFLGSLALAAVVAGVAAAHAPAAAPMTVRPALSVATPGVVTIAGTRFKPNERVTLRLSGLGQPRVKIVVTSAGGRLSARFLQDVPDCTPFTVSAIGNRGSRVSFREIPPPCGIVIQP